MNFTISLDLLSIEDQVQANSFNHDDFHIIPATKSRASPIIRIEDDLRLLERLAGYTRGNMLVIGGETISAYGHRFELDVRLSKEEEQHIRYHQAYFPLLSYTKDVLGVENALDRMELVDHGGNGPVSLSPPLRPRRKGPSSDSLCACIYSLLDAYLEIGCVSDLRDGLLPYIPERHFHPMFDRVERDHTQFYHIAGLPLAPRIEMNASISVMMNDRPGWTPSITDHYVQGGLFSLTEPIKSGYIHRFRDPFFLSCNPSPIISSEFLQYLRSRDMPVIAYPILEPGCPFKDAYEATMREIQHIIAVNPLNNLQLNCMYPPPPKRKRGS